MDHYRSDRTPVGLGPIMVQFRLDLGYISLSELDDDDEFRFNDASAHEGHLRQNGELTWFCNETIIMISHKCIKCKTRTNE